MDKNIKVNNIKSIYDNIQNLLYAFLTLIIESKILISLSSTFFILASCNLIDKSYLANFDLLHFILYTLFFISTLAIYNLHKKYNSLISLTKSTKSKTLNKLIPNKALIAIFGILFLLGYGLYLTNDFLSNILFVNINYSTLNISIFFLKFIFPIGIISLLYSIPFIPDFRKTLKKLNNQNLLRLKDIPFLKLFLIAFVWAYNSILPIYIQEFINSPKIIPDYFNISRGDLLLLIFLQNFIFIMAITLPFDIRDKNYDKERGIITIPNYFDLNNNNLSIILMILVILFSIISNLFFNIYSITQLILLIFFDIRIIFTLKKYSFNQDHLLEYNKLNLNNKFALFWQKYYFYGVLDGLILIRSLLILFFYN